MIRRIEIKNFQSHKKTNLNLSPGINAIIGSSDSGKSAILRALNWTIYNRPSGDALVSNWNKNEKGKLIDDSFTTIIKDDNVLTRMKKKDFNGYIINSSIAGAIGTDVPEQVQDFFDLSEVNIQKQTDAHFLLSNTAGEVARFFNKIIKLDDIDKALYLVEKKKNGTNSEIKRTSKEIEELEPKLDSYNWIDKAEELSERLDVIYDKIQKKKHDTEELKSDIQTYNNINKSLEGSKKIIELEEKVDKIFNIKKEIEEKSKSKNILENSIEEYNNCKDVLKSTDKILKTENNVRNLLELYEKIKKLNRNIKNYENSIQNFKETKENINIMDEKIKELNERIPDICPLCGNQMKGVSNV